MTLCMSLALATWIQDGTPADSNPGEGWECSTNTIGSTLTEVSHYGGRQDGQAAIPGARTTRTQQCWYPAGWEAPETPRGGGHCTQLSTAAERGARAAFIAAIHSGATAKQANSKAAEFHESAAEHREHANRVAEHRLAAVRAVVVAEAATNTAVGTPHFAAAMERLERAQACVRAWDRALLTGSTDDFQAALAS